MDDQKFMFNALKQSFYCPIVQSVNTLDMQICERSFTFCDIQHTKLLNYVLPTAKIKTYLKNIKYDTQNNANLYTEYDLYKHDVCENIIIPEDLPQVQQMRQQLDLLTVNRQGAQKKCICARIIPTTFSDCLKEIHSQYKLVMLEIERFLQNQPDSVNLSMLDDFAGTYRAFMALCRINHPTLLRNQKQLRCYLNEAAQILKAPCPLPEDFEETHRFRSENKRFGRKAAIICHDYMRLLVSMLQKMAHEAPLLSLVQTLLDDEIKFTKELHFYRKDKKISELEKVTNVRHYAQKLFERYAFLNYLNGVRFAFENIYLNECPESRNPPLSTVSPTEELKKVAKLVDESKHLHPTGSRIAPIFTDALNDYDNMLQNLKNALEQA